MIIIPKEKPVIENLNSYYLKIDKLLEHYQGALESGGVYFKAPTVEAVVFFADENILNGSYKDKRSQVTGQAAIDRIIKGPRKATVRYPYIRFSRIGSITGRV